MMVAQINQQTNKSIQQAKVMTEEKEEEEEEAMNSSFKKRKRVAVAAAKDNCCAAESKKKVVQNAPTEDDNDNTVTKERKSMTPTPKKRECRPSFSTKTLTKEFWRVSFVFFACAGRNFCAATFQDQK